MTFQLRTAFFAAALFGAAGSFATLAMTTPAAADANAQYCVARGGSNGESSYVGNCNYSDYQQCLQAAADSRGNCVQNIDYHPGAQPAAPRRSRRAR